MECGKLTAKLRDAVPVCFIEDGKEVKRYKNIEIPDEVKKLPFKAFDFNVPLTGAITFKISTEPEEAPQEYSMALYYHVTGEQRKALVAAVSAYIDAPAVYQNAPTFAYAIGEYRVDKEGTLTGTADEALVTALQAEGFMAE